MKGEIRKVVSVVKGPAKMSKRTAPVFVRTTEGVLLVDAVEMVSGSTEFSSQVRMDEDDG